MQFINLFETRSVQRILPGEVIRKFWHPFYVKDVLSSPPSQGSEYTPLLHYNSKSVIPHTCDTFRDSRAVCTWSVNFIEIGAKHVFIPLAYEHGVNLNLNRILAKIILLISIFVTKSNLLWSNTDLYKINYSICFCFASVFLNSIKWRGKWNG